MTAENSNAPIYRENSCIWVNFSIRLQFDTRDLKHVLRLAAVRTFTFVQNPVNDNAGAAANPLRPVSAHHDALKIIYGQLTQGACTTYPRDICPHLAVRLVISGFTAELTAAALLAIENRYASVKKSS